MTRDDILRMAREASSEDGSVVRDDGKTTVLYAAKTSQFLERFAALVAAAERDRLEPAFEQMEALMKIREGQPNKPCCLAEREACAKLCEKRAITGECYIEGSAEADGCAAAIRTRGNT